MNDDHKLRLAAGRREAHQRRLLRENALVLDYLEWVRLEREAFRRLQLAYELSDGVSEARTEWRCALSLMPKLAPDSAFERVRGDLSGQSAIGTVMSDAA